MQEPVLTKTGLETSHSSPPAAPSPSDPFGDGIPFGLPTLEEAQASRRSALMAARSDDAVDGAYPDELLDLDAADALQAWGGPIHDPDELCQALAPMGRSRRLAFLNRLFSPPKLTLTEAERLHARRAMVAMSLANDLDTCHDLMAGLPVRPSALRQDALKAARRRRLVRLDVREIDLLIPGSLDSLLGAE